MQCGSVCPEPGYIGQDSDTAKGAVMRTASVRPDALDALLEQWRTQGRTLELVRDVCFEWLSREPGSELAGLVLMATAMDVED